MSLPNNAHYLRAAQQRRRADPIDRVRDAARDLDATGQEITVAAVVRASGASRAFIYRLPDILQQIQKLRDQQAATGQRQPARERASVRAFVERAGSTIATIRAITVSPPGRVTRTMPVPFSVPANTSSPTGLSTGSGSPVIVASEPSLPR